MAKPIMVSMSWMGMDGLAKSSSAAFRRQEVTLSQREVPVARLKIRSRYVAFKPMWSAICSLFLIR